MAEAGVLIAHGFIMLNQFTFLHAFLLAKAGVLSSHGCIMLNQLPFFASIFHGRIRSAYCPSVDITI